MNKELIKWMAEKRESLTFEAKVQLIKNFWDNKNEIQDFAQKYGQTNLAGVEQLIQKEWEGVKKVITEKNNRLAQLEKLFKGTSQIFQKQHNYVDKLKKDLETEQKEKGISEEKAQHLEADIKNLEQQKQELANKIKELEKLERESKEIKEKELAELQKKLNQERQTHQEQLRKINLLWDKNAENYEKIEFDGLYELLKRESKGVVLTEHEIKGLELIWEASEKNYNLISASFREDIFKECKNISKELNNWGIGMSGKLATTTTTTTNFPHMAGKYSFFGIFNTFYLAFNTSFKRISEMNKNLSQKPPISLEQWNSDYSKRPTLSEFEGVKAELAKEKGWWDKWIEDKELIIKKNQQIMNKITEVMKNPFPAYYQINFNNNFSDESYGGVEKRFEGFRRGRRIFKEIIRPYYLDK